MLRSEDVVFGTSTTGTGSLTLVVDPSASGGIDPYLAFVGRGVGTSLSFPLPYVIEEFTDATFKVRTALEVGYASLTLGANLAACTFARSKVMFTATALDTTPVVSDYGTAPSAISIGTAANVLIHIGPTANSHRPTLTNIGNFTSGGASSALVGNAGQIYGGSAGSIGWNSDQLNFHQFDWAGDFPISTFAFSVKTAPASAATFDFGVYMVGSDNNTLSLYKKLTENAQFVTSTTGLKVLTATNFDKFYLPPGPCLICGLMQGPSSVTMTGCGVGMLGHMALFGIRADSPEAFTQLRFNDVSYTALPTTKTISGASFTNFTGNGGTSPLFFFGP